MTSSIPRVAMVALLGALAACNSTPSAPTRDAAPQGTTAPLRMPPPQVEQDPPAAQAHRAELVAHIRAGAPGWGDRRWNERVLSALQKVPRHLFVPGAPLGVAYEDRPLPIGHDQTISQPTVVAIMTDALELLGNERVLEIGTGSGYQAAVLALLAREVLTIEIVEPLGVAAKERLAALGYRNVEVRIGDGYAGWPERAPFDRILLTAAPPEVPQKLVEQLAEGGILVAPVGEGRSQKLVRWTRRGGRITKEDLGDVLFVPMVPGTAP